jgi:hypothetical protein
MKSKLALALSLLASTTILLSAPVAHADTITLTLASPTQNTLPGTTMSYVATVSAPSTNTGIEFLNGDLFSLSSPITLNDSGYINNFPLDLTPGQSFTGVLFTLFVPSTAKPGLYPGSFSITGGSNSSSNDVLATVTFNAAVAPEPSSLLLMGTGMVLLLGAATLKKNTLSAVRT